MSARIYQEKRWPYQWIGTCPRHEGGIRCNDEQRAREFMADLCARFHDDEEADE